MTAEQILRQVADWDPIEWEYLTCTMCPYDEQQAHPADADVQYEHIITKHLCCSPKTNAWRHLPNCPWRLAKEFFGEFVLTAPLNPKWNEALGNQI